jgi:hypothetical protein
VNFKELANKYDKLEVNIDGKWIHLATRFTFCFPFKDRGDIACLDSSNSVGNFLMIKILDDKIYIGATVDDLNKDDCFSAEYRLRE